MAQRITFTLQHTGDWKATPADGPEEGITLCGPGLRKIAGVDHADYEDGDTVDIVFVLRKYNNRHLIQFELEEIDGDVFLEINRNIDFLGEARDYMRTMWDKGYRHVAVIPPVSKAPPAPLEDKIIVLNQDPCSSGNDWRGPNVTICASGMNDFVEVPCGRHVLHVRATENRPDGLDHYTLRDPTSLAGPGLDLTAKQPSFYDNTLRTFKELYKAGYRYIQVEYPR